MLSNHLILCHPLLLSPSIIPSIRVSSNKLALHITWPKYWSFSFSTSSSNEYSGLISFKTDWFNLCAVQGTLKSLLQHHKLKASTLWCSAFFRGSYSQSHFPQNSLFMLLLSHFSRVRLCATPEMAAHQAPQSLGFSRQEHWSGLPFPSPMHESEKWKGSHSVVSDP